MGDDDEGNLDTACVIVILGVLMGWYYIFFIHGGTI